MSEVFRCLRWVLLPLFLGLAGCSVNQISLGQDATPVPYPGPVKPARAPIPGGYWMYAFGSGQKKENFEDVEIAQSDYGIWGFERNWIGLAPSRRAFGHISGLQLYFPLHVRWRMKDGREFILEYIDVPELMREYFKNKRIDLPWQREKRPKADIGDLSPTLAHEVKGDSLIIKWVITINRIPPMSRLTPEGKAVPFDTYDEEYIVAVIKGVPVTGLDFGKTREIRNTYKN